MAFNAPNSANVSQRETKKKAKKRRKLRCFICGDGFYFDQADCARCRSKAEFQEPIQKGPYHGT